MNTRALFYPGNLIRLILAGLLGVLIAEGEAAGQAGDSLRLVFHMQQEQAIYDQSSYGEPPQIAVWLEDSATGKVRTLFVTRRTARGKYIGKVECPVSLPIWIGAFRRETGRNDFPTPMQPFFGAVTGATPKTKDITVTASVEAGRSFNYFIEMNVAGDYNRAFPKLSASKRPDNHGNGQPSLLFKGTIKSTAGATSKPVCAGRSHHYYFVTEADPDLAGIDSALQVFRVLSVECTSIP